MADKRRARPTKRISPSAAAPAPAPAPVPAPVAVTSIELPGAVQELLKLAMSGNKLGCTQLIPTLSLPEINTVLDDSTGTTLLMKAIEFGFVDMVQLLLMHGADPRVKNKAGQSILLLACIKNNLDTIRAVRVHLKDIDCEPELGLVLALPSLSEASILAAVAVLLGDGSAPPAGWAAPADAASGGSATTALHIAASLGMPTVVSKLLLHGFGGHLNTYDKRGCTPIQLAETGYKRNLGQFLSRTDLRKYRFKAGKTLLRNRERHEADAGSSDASTGDAASLNDEEQAWEEFEDDNREDFDEDDEEEERPGRGQGARVASSRAASSNASRSTGGPPMSAHRYSPKESSNDGDGRDGMYEEAGDNSWEDEDEDDDDDDDDSDSELEEDEGEDSEINSETWFDRESRMREGLKTADPAKCAAFKRCILLLVQAMGFKSAVYSEYGLTSMTCLKIVMTARGVPDCLNSLSEGFRMTPWGRVGLQRASDGSRIAIPHSTEGIPLCPSDNHPMALSTHTPERYAVVGWQCNACSIRGKKTTPRWYCQTCSDDYCCTCVPGPQAIATATTTAATAATTTAAITAAITAATGHHTTASESVSFLDSLTAQFETVTVADKKETEPKSNKKNRRGGKAASVATATTATTAAPVSSLERDMKSCNLRLSSQQQEGNLPEEERFLSHPDPGFMEDTDIDMFIEALTVCAEMFRDATSGGGSKDRRAAARAQWAEATGATAVADHSLSHLLERTIRAIMLCIVDNSSEIEASVPLEWATILQEYTNHAVEEHVLPVQCFSNLGICASAAPAVPTESLVTEPLTMRMVLDIDKDPLYTLCHPSVTTALLLRLSEMGFIIAYGLTGQVI
jgi:hypothetical protein